MNDIVLDATKNDSNYFSIDVTGDIDAEDEVSFRAARAKSHLNDDDAVIVKKRTQGVVDVAVDEGIVQVQIFPAETDALTDEALVFHVVLHKTDVNMDTTVASGVMRLT